MKHNSPPSSLKNFTGVLGAAALALTGCGPSKSQNSSSTHWLSCNSDLICLSAGASCDQEYCVDDDGDRVEVKSSGGSIGSTTSSSNTCQLPDNHVLEYAAALGDDSIAGKNALLVVVRPEPLNDYESFRAFVGPPGELVERRVLEVRRAGDGGTTIVQLLLDGTTALAHFGVASLAPKDGEEPPAPTLDIDGSEHTLSYVNDPKLDDYKLHCIAGKAWAKAGNSDGGAAPGKNAPGVNDGGVSDDGPTDTGSDDLDDNQRCWQSENEEACTAALGAPAAANSPSCAWVQAWQMLRAEPVCEYVADTGVCVLVDTRGNVDTNTPEPAYHVGAGDVGQLVIPELSSALGKGTLPPGFTRCHANASDPACVCAAAGDIECREPNENSSTIPAAWCDEPGRCAIGIALSGDECGCSCASIAPPTADCAPLPAGVKEGGYTVVDGGCDVNCAGNPYGDACGCGCVSDEIAAEQCALAPDPGTCDETLQRFAFNPDTSECEAFEYGGCGGNWNNFRTIESCEQFCGNLAPRLD